MRLNPIVKPPDQDEPKRFLSKKHVKDDEIGVTLREQGSSNVTSKRCGDSISTVVVQMCTCIVVVITLIKSGGTVCYVLDGGSHMHLQDVTYSDIINEYVNYVKRLHCNYTVLFDGYGSGPSTQDIMLTRRRSGRVARDIDFSGNVPVRVKMEKILSNGAKKQRLIIVLIRTLHGAGYGAI